MKVLFVLAFLAFLGVAFSATFSEALYREKFTGWMRTNQKTYSNEDFLHRYQIFKHNMDYVEAWNARKDKFTMKLNKFADLSSAEFSALYKGLKYDSEKIELQTTVTNIPVPSIPASLDWRTSNIVTPVKNQGQCGSCWSFSTTGSVEGAHAQKTSKLVGLSEQNLVDCATIYGCEGCNGGLMTLAMLYIINNKGLDTEASYPYTAEDGSCAFNANNVGSTLSAMVNVSSQNETDLLYKAAVGPTSVAIDASATSFQFYTGGVYYSYECSTTQLDHGVLVVGYGVDGSDAYWLVKNSWGSDWGEAGYIKMIRNWDNNCGIATMATLPVY